MVPSLIYPPAAQLLSHTGTLLYIKCRGIFYYTEAWQNEKPQHHSRTLKCDISQQVVFDTVFFFYFKNNVRLPFSYIKYNLWLYIIYHLTGKCFSLLKTVADNSVRENKTRGKEICICNNNIKRKILFCLCPSFYSPASWSFTVACCTILLIAWSKPIIKIIRLCCQRNSMTSSCGW